MDPTIIPVVAIGGSFMVAICGSAIYFAYMAWKTSSDTALKRDMVARGYTADEIIAVIAAGHDATGNRPLASSEMAANYYSADEIAAVVAAEHGATSKRPLPSVPPAKPIKQPVYSP